MPQVKREMMMRYRKFELVQMRNLHIQFKTGVSRNVNKLKKSIDNPINASDLRLHVVND
ncbi:MAG: hypothetical protein P0Y55_07550 [Candidatus Cohnella colombiensis]|uniref:Uncharacterized protein n=1 Tax=Candidatus Cohnella colombiensis TaxID=3121368 RepID=A0AA95EYK7_9BACL|nr:MAG: hypothetical protein P0Y55_07550 [Cohnella sp.]